MEWNEMAKRLFEMGKGKGAADMEAFGAAGRQLEIKFFKGEMADYSLSESRGISLRGLVDGKMGYSYSEKLDEESAALLAEQMAGSAAVIDSEDKQEIYAGSDTYRTVDVYNPKLDETPVADKIEFTRELEQAALDQDKRVDAVDYCLYGETLGEVWMINTKGLNLHEKANLAYAYLSVVVKEGGDIKTGDKFVAGNDFAKFSAKKLAEQAVQEALSLLGAKSVPAGGYPVILRYDAAGDLLGAFSGIFSAEAVQKGLSLLKGKLNESVAADTVSIIDDPFMAGGLASASFDGEGVAARYKRVVDKGVLTTYLHNLKTAAKDNVESTGNASKPSYKATVGIAPSNFYIENGETSLESMMQKMGRGLLIINVQGLHSGLNPVSGDFSLPATGYLIEDGRIARPVDQITIAGNFFSMLKEVVMVGSDLTFGMPGTAYIGSPSLWVKSLSVSGA